MEEDKQKALEVAITSLDRQFGKGTVVRLGSDEIVPWPAISTGAFTLDLALGIGGFPKGRIVEVYGPESSGKTTLALNVIAQAQADGGICAFVDTEHALDPVYARALGVNVEDLLISQPDYGEAALNVVDTLVKTGAVAVVVVDSVAALIPKAELEGSMGDSHMGLQPRLMSQAMRKLVGPSRETETLVVFTNQLREKIGVVYGNPETQPGGRALKFYASVRIDIRKKEVLKDATGEMAGAKVAAKVVKNKMAAPFRVAEFDILYGRGIDQLGCVVDAALSRGVLTKAGGWIKYHDEVFAQGRQNAVANLASDLDLADTIKGEILGV